MSQDIALYIHFPFCHRKCRYCSFISYSNRESDIPTYLNALKRELAQCADNSRVTSIYFGGGTPSLLGPDQFADLLSAIHSLFVVDEAAEITIEANPGTVDEPYLSAIRRLGVNRLSLGVQSLNNDELALLGRIHSADEAREAIGCARKSGFDNMSIDLIYGLPGQTIAQWQSTLEEVIDLSPEHLSLYPLTLECDTPLYEAIESRELPAISPDLVADQYELAEDLLAINSYQHYEISNWAREGQECRHNLTYWRNSPYLGIGVAAHSYVGGRRYSNTSNLDSYLHTFENNLPFVLDIDEDIEPELQLSETVILGMRLRDGININDISDRYGMNLLWRYGHAVNELTDWGLLECVDQCIRLTRRGRLLGNEVFWRFLPV